MSFKGDTPNVYAFEKQDCYTFEFEKTDDEITEEMKHSGDKETLLKCLSAGVLPDVLKDKNIEFKTVEVYKTEEIIVEKETGEIKQNKPEYTPAEAALDSPVQDCFERNIDTDTVICPMGKTLYRKGKIASKGTRYANKKVCKNCKNKCTSSRFRTVDFKDGKNIVKTDFYTKASWRFNAVKTRLPSEKIIRRQIPNGHKVILKFYPDRDIYQDAGNE